WLGGDGTRTGKRTARGMDPGLRPTEPVDDVPAARDDARNRRTADLVVARGGGRGDESAEARVGRVDERDEGAGRPRPREDARAVHVERDEQVLITLQDEERRAGSAVEPLPEEAGRGCYGKRRAHPGIVERRVIGD